MQSKEISVKEKISHVDIYVNFPSIDEKIVLIDTPGMNGTENLFGENTLREIRRSNASICLFHIRGMGNSDLVFLRKLAEYQDTLFFVLNHIDTLNESEGENYESRLKRFRSEIQQLVFNNTHTPKNVFGVSALKALVSRDMYIKKLYANDEDELSQERRQECWNTSNFQKFENALYGFLESDEKEKTFLNDIIDQLRATLEGVAEECKEYIDIINAKTNELPERRILLAQKDKILNSINQVYKSIEGEITAKIGDLKDEVKDDVRKLCEQEEDVVEKMVREISTVEDMETFIKQAHVTNHINTFYSQLRDKVENKMNEQLDKIYQNVISKVIRKALPDLVLTDKNAQAKWNFKYNDTSSYEYTEKIETLSKQIKELQAEQKSIDVHIKNADKLEQEIVSKSRELEKNKNSKRNELYRLGTRPPKRRYTETVARKERFLIFFSRTRYEEVVRYDDSAQRNYDKEKENIEKRYQIIIPKLQKELQQLEAHQDSIGDKLYLKRRQEQLSQEIEKKEKRRKYELEDIEMQKKNARTSWLKDKKREIIESVRKYISVSAPYGDLYATIRSEIDKNVNTPEARMKQDLRAIYDGKRKEIIRKIDCSLEKLNGQVSADIKKDVGNLYILKQNIEKKQKDLNNIIK